ncbi:MAG TPA: tetratricopeptide repeat protein [Thermoanaerobaculia bacterium]|nr:tetratricopeptide repeat protein [Thermoanaerobaculia bacterium]
MRSFLLAVSLFAGAAIQGAGIDQLRADYAQRFLDPQAHLRLSKHLEANGQRLTAFFVSEAARRQYFGDEVFDPAFRLVILDDPFDNSPEAEKRLAAAVAAAPGDAATLMKLADVYISRSNWKKAEPLVRKAIALAPDEHDYFAVLEQILVRANRLDDALKVRKQWADAHPQARETTIERVQQLLRAESPEAEKALAAALAAYPDEGILHFHHAGVLAEKDPAAAEKAYLRAAELEPKLAMVQGWTGRFFLKNTKEPERALEHYLNAYFLDPHFYDSEYAESRIRSLAYDRAQALIAAQPGADVATLLRHPDPVVVGLTIDRAGGAWKPEYAEPLISLLAHDDPNVRAMSSLVLSHHLAAADPRLDALLAHDDLRVRGMAAYIAGAKRGEAIVPLMTSWLDHPAQLIRYDAMSVLAMHGGKAGRDVLMKLRRSGKYIEPRLRDILDIAAGKKPR